MELKFSTIKDDKKEKGAESETDSGMIVKPDDVPKEMRLATLDIFSGCGGLSYGLEKAGMYNVFIFSNHTLYLLEKLVFICMLCVTRCM